jgi:hypothetical protein
MGFIRYALLAAAIVTALPAGAAPQPETAVKVAKLRESYAGVSSDYERAKSELNDLCRVRFTVAPALLLLGETVTVRLAAHTDRSPNPRLEILENCYAKTPDTQTVDLAWKRNRSKDGYVAAWTWKPPRCGNYLVHWTCDIGGDVPEFWRNVSVIDDSYAVMILNSTSHVSPRPEPDFHELHLPFSPWFEQRLFGSYPSAESFAGPSRGARQFGDDLSLLIFHSGDYLPDTSAVFSDEPEEVQRLVLECYTKLNAMFGLPRPITSLLTYGIGDGPARVARRLGYNQIGALCADQNWQDGTFKINHWGMPARPYFVSRQDFRKPGDGGPRAMVGVQQCERQTMECRDYNCVYAFEGGIAYALDRYSGIERPRLVSDLIASREMDFLQCFIEAAGQTRAPLFFCTGIEFNGVWPEMAAFNRTFMEYMVRRAGDARIAYTTATAVGDFFRRHYRETPESVLYLPDVYAGLVNSGKPACYPDTMEVENHLFRAVFIKGRALPQVYYDYTTRWDYPDWGNDGVPRGPAGYIIPNTDDRFRVTPKILDTRLFEVSSTVREEAKQTVVQIEVVAKRAQRNLALAVWDLPREYARDVRQFRLTGARRFIPVRAAYTHNLCGIIVADVKKGKNSITLAVGTEPRAITYLDLRLGGNLMAKVFERDGAATAYLYNTGAAPETLRLTPLEGVTYQLVPFDSDAPVAVAGPTEITIERGKCQRLVGPSYDALAKCFPGATPVGQDDAVRALLGG